jgi:hypothetical protein
MADVPSERQVVGHAPDEGFHAVVKSTRGEMTFVTVHGPALARFGSVNEGETVAGKCWLLVYSSRRPRLPLRVAMLYAHRKVLGIAGGPQGDSQCLMGNRNVVGELAVEA